MTHWLTRLLHMREAPGDNEKLQIPDQGVPPEASAEKLLEAQAWTARKRDEIERMRRDYREHFRYELELEQETGKARRPAQRQ